jgi:putative hydrolase of the HAD superfamily
MTASQEDPLTIADPPTGGRRRRRPLWIVVALLSVFTLSCRADLRVDVDVEPDGSGLVAVALELDREAAEQLLDLDRETGGGIPLADLAEAGWEVAPPEQQDDGSVVIEAGKAFGTTSQFSEVMDELSGPDGITRDFVLSRNQSFGRLDYTVTGVLDTSSKFLAFTDPELETALTRSLQAIAERYQASEQNVGIELNVTLPGELQEDQSNGVNTIGETGVAARWQTTLANPNPVDVTFSTTRRAIAAQVLRGVAVLAGVLAALLIFSRLLRLLGSWRRPEPPAKPRPADAKGRRPGERRAVIGGPVRPHSADQSNDDVDDFGRERQYRVVALDGMGVLYREGKDIRELLIPFARQRGSEVPAEDIAAKARLMSLGRLTPTDFWPSIGVSGDPNELDASYLSGHQLSSGVVRYLRKLRSDGVRAACVTNDGAEWANKLRSSHSLDGLIDPWVISGSVGVRKPETPIFEVLRRIVGEPPNRILIIDDNLDSLDAARSLGFGTVWFKPDGERDLARGHELWRRFETDDEEYQIETVAAVTGEILPQEPPTA